MNSSKFFLTGLLTVASSLSVSAVTTLYTETFSGSGSASLNGAAPSTAVTGDGASASATWSSHLGMLNNGFPVNANDSSAILSFVPVADRIYTLSLDFQAGNAAADNDWAGFGFTYNGVVGSPGTNPAQNAGRFTDAGQLGALWTFVREASTNTGGDQDIQLFVNGTSIQIATTETDAQVDGFAKNTLSLVLDTAGGNLATNLLLNGSSITNGFQIVTGLTLAQINGVGITHNNTTQTGTNVDNFILTSIPEPSTYAALVGVIALAAVGLRRRRA